MHYDALVIGGGLAGCATACYLAEAGLSVALLERGEINRGASGQNAGSLHFQLEHRLIHHADALADELQHYVALTQVAIDHWRGIEAELESPLELAMHGGLMLAETDEDIGLLERKAAIEQAQGLEVTLLDAAQTQARAPYLSPAVRAALYCPHEGHCNPRLLTPAYARKAKRLGASIVTHCAVTETRRQGNRWRVRGALGSGEVCEWTSDVLVNAAGAWAMDLGRMANLHLPVFPVGLLMNVTERTALFIHHLIQHVGRRLSMKQVDDGNVLIGGGWSARLPQQHGQWLPGRPQVDMAALRANLRTALAVAPGIESLRVLRSWTGTTGITPDQLPLIGAVSRAPGYYVAAGGSGFTYGPTYARLLSELITRGEASHSLAPYSPDRFAHMNMFMG
ncbi:NAD(P)/FAD-dependent oxidoreductase [Parahaliea mediterranea]|uniref:NAD(P)/FAD-dependent oxidoreductase n=1 Tax=Parahaliea mediterranea TaxID=651086 RepID=UPI0019D41C33|nr:FAD-dependent oxidoreductase [Parahaliea mediterranea]